jgi:hypothetical protein
MMETIATPLNAPMSIDQTPKNSSNGCAVLTKTNPGDTVKERGNNEP